MFQNKTAICFLFKIDTFIRIMMWSVYNQRNFKMLLTKITWFLFLIYIKLLIIIIYSYKKKSKIWENSATGQMKYHLN